MAKKNLQVSLPARLDAELEDQARRLRTPAPVLARRAIEEWVRRQRRAQLAEETRAFADEMTGTAFDLDAAFEAAGAEHRHDRES